MSNFEKIMSATMNARSLAFGKSVTMIDANRVFTFLYKDLPNRLCGSEELRVSVDALSEKMAVSKIAKHLPGWSIVYVAGDEDSRRFYFYVVKD